MQHRPLRINGFIDHHQITVTINRGSSMTLHDTEYS